MACTSAQKLHSDTGRTLVPHSAAAGREPGLESRLGPAPLVPLAVEAELPGKAAMEEVKGMQRGLVVRLWSNLRACLTCSPKRGSAGRPPVQAGGGASRCIREALIVRNLLGTEESSGQLASLLCVRQLALSPEEYICNSAFVLSEAPYSGASLSGPL